MSHYTNTNTRERDVDKLKDKVRALDSKLATQERLVKTLTEDTASDKKFTRPDPPVYKNRWNDYKLDAWIFKMHAKLQHPPLKDYDRETQIQYVVSRLGGEAFDHVKHRLPGASRLGFDTSPNNEFQSPSEVLAELRKASVEKAEKDKSEACTIM